MKSEASRSVTLKLDTTVGMLIAWLGKIPNTAKLDVHVTKGDRPFDSDQTTLTARWTEDDDERDLRPHSRACGARLHPHGVECNNNCPTCHGKAE